MTKLTVLNTDVYGKMLRDKEIIVSYAYEESPFGECLIGFIEGKLCHVSFVKVYKNRNFEMLKKEWPGAIFREEPHKGEVLKNKVFDDNVSVDIIVRGTSFQEKVWRALMEIKKGETRFYSDVARAIGCPAATRAVANAIAKNPVSYVVPCHRVISKTGDIYKYGGGCMTKKKLLEFEGFREKTCSM